MEHLGLARCGLTGPVRVWTAGHVQNNRSEQRECRRNGEEARVPLDLAIRASTLGAAYALGRDDEIGSIEVGKKADLVVLGENLFDIDVYDISETPVMLTMMNGVVRHREGR